MEAPLLMIVSRYARKDNNVRVERCNEESASDSAGSRNDELPMSSLMFWVFFLHLEPS